MNQYLAAAHRNEEAERSTGHMKIKTWLEVTRQTREAYREALLALDLHRTEHGC
jgi:hypothetical protein